MGIGIHIRVYAQRNVGDFAFLSGDLRQQFQLRFGFNIEAENTYIQGARDFIGTFTHAGKYNARWLAAGAQYTFQFTTGYYVKTGAEFGEHI